MIELPERRVLRWDPYLNPDECDVDFRLTYEGRLLAHREPVGKRAFHKHEIRQHFHKQLKELWGIHPVLRSVSREMIKGPPHPTKRIAVHKIAYLDWASTNWQSNGFRWVPLVTEQRTLMCKLEILLLRGGKPGQIVQRGDIDNRLKTVFDALKIPRSAAELGGATPGPGEDPFFVLLEDDELVSHVAVETDTLLAPINGDENDARLVINVSVKAYQPIGNEGF